MKLIQRKRKERQSNARIRLSMVSFNSAKDRKLQGNLKGMPIMEGFSKEACSLLLPLLVSLPPSRSVYLCLYLSLSVNIFSPSVLQCCLFSSKHLSCIFWVWHFVSRAPRVHMDRNGSILTKHALLLL